MTFTAAPLRRNDGLSDSWVGKTRGQLTHSKTCSVLQSTVLLSIVAVSSAVLLSFNVIWLNIHYISAEMSLLSVGSVAAPLSWLLKDF